MIVDSEPRPGRWSRLLLLAGGVGLAWCALTLFGQSSSASAVEDDPSGLVGVVGSAVEQTMTTVIDDVEPIVIDVVQSAVPPAPAPAPAPAQNAPLPAVAPVTRAVAATTSAVSDVAATATSTLQGTAATVGAVPDAVATAVSTTTTGIVSSVSIADALAPLLSAIDELPIVGPATGQAGVTDSLGSLVTSIDDLIAMVVGTATTVVATPGHPGGGGTLPLPGALLPADETQPIPVVPPGDSVASSAAQQGLVFGGFFAAALVVGAIAPLTSASSTRSGRWGGVPHAPSGSPSILVGASVTAAALWAAVAEFSWRAHVRGSAALSLSNDALPGAPVFATDVSPD